jgi:hypothetical protein
LYYSQDDLQQFLDDFVRSLGWFWMDRCPSRCVSVYGWDPTPTLTVAQTQTMGARRWIDDGIILEGMHRFEQSNILSRQIEKSYQVDREGMREAQTQIHYIAWSPCGVPRDWLLLRLCYLVLSCGLWTIEESLDYTREKQLPFHWSSCQIKNPRAVLTSYPSPCH